MEFILMPESVVNYDQLLNWTKEELAEYIMYCTYIRFPEDTDDDIMEKAIAQI